MEQCDLISEYYFSNRKYFFSIARSRFKKSFADDIFVDEFLDDIFIKVVKTKIYKEGFSNIEHFIRYFRKSINNNSKKAYWIRKKELEKQNTMSNHERIKNFTLARSIINDNRNF